MRMSSAAKLFISLLLITCGWQLTSIGLALEKQAWRDMAPGSETALEFVRKYAEHYQNNLTEIYLLASSLEDENRTLEVVTLYQAAHTYHPNQRKLLYRLNLARSDLRESKSIKTFNHQQNKKFSYVILRDLDEIKCATLRSTEGTQACKRLGRDKPELKLANYNNSNVVEKPRSTAIEIREEPFIKNLESEQGYSHDDLDDIEIGDFHALVIGNNDYRHFPRLETAIYDAKAVKTVLESNYGFKVTRLENANRYEIFEKLSQLRKQLDSKDNLLIYYAGHGYMDEDTQRGYWLPVDAEDDNYANWLSTNDITDMLNGMSAKRVLVVADSCYSGTLTRGLQLASRSIDSDQLKWLQRIAKNKSRTVMTSGGLEPVLDSGGNNNSIFTKAFINALLENESILEASRMFTTVRRSVILNADQTPEYADIRKAGHEGGDFIFMRVN